MHKPGKKIPPAIHYWLIQLPEILLIAVLAGIAVRYGLLSGSSAVFLFVLWLLKDLLIYPVFVRTAWLYYPMGREALIGAHGEVVSATTPSQPGQIRVNGEIWKARSVDDHHFEPGERVEVFGAEGLTLWVKPL